MKPRFSHRILSSLWTLIATFIALVSWQMAGFASGDCPSHECNVTPCPPANPGNCGSRATHSWSACATSTDGDCCQYQCVTISWIGGGVCTGSWTSCSILYADFGVHCNDVDGECE